MCPEASNQGSQRRDSSESKQHKDGPSLKRILAAQALQETGSVNLINSCTPSVGSHCFEEFLLGTHNWVQKCLVDPGANINCVSFGWISKFETPPWDYNLECGRIKTAGGHTLKCEARVLLKVSWPPEDPQISVEQWFYIVHGEEGVVFGTPACLALGIIDQNWPRSSLQEHTLRSPTRVKTISTEH